MSPPPMLISPSMVACVSHAAMSYAGEGEVKGERLAAFEGGEGCRAAAGQGDRGGYFIDILCRPS